MDQWQPWHYGVEFNQWKENIKAYLNHQQCGNTMCNEL